MRNARNPKPDLMLCVNAKGTESDLYRGGGAAVPLSSTESRMWEAGRAPLKVLPKGAAPPPQAQHGPTDPLPQRNGPGDRCEGAWGNPFL